MHLIKLYAGSHNSLANQNLETTALIQAHAYNSSTERLNLERHIIKPSPGLLTVLVTFLLMCYETISKATYASLFGA